MKNIISITLLTSLIVMVTAVEFYQLQTSQLARLSEGFEIHPKQKSLFNNLGMIHGLRQCGGSGKLLYWRDEACVAFPNSLCIRPVSQYFRGEMAFIPSQNSDSLGISVVAIETATGVNLTAWDSPYLPNSSVEGDKEYVVTASTAADKAVSGKLITTKISIFRDSDKEVETCAEAEIYYP